MGMLLTVNIAFNFSEKRCLILCHTLIKKLSACGISGNFLEYLEMKTHRLQTVHRCKWASSTLADVEFGVPQGSNIGPSSFSNLSQCK